MEFAEGGMVTGGKDLPPRPLTHGLCYAIPPEFARLWAKDMLDKINAGLDKPDEDGVELDVETDC